MIKFFIALTISTMSHAQKVDPNEGIAGMAKVQAEFDAKVAQKQTLKDVLKSKDWTKQMAPDKMQEILKLLVDNLE